MDEVQVNHLPVNGRGRYRGIGYFSFRSSCVGARTIYVRTPFPSQNKSQLFVVFLLCCFPNKTFLQPLIYLYLHLTMLRLG